MAESQSSKTDREKKGHHDSTVPTSSSLSPAGFIGKDVAITHMQNKQPNVNFSKQDTPTSREKERGDCVQRHRITINGNLILFWHVSRDYTKTTAFQTNESHAIRRSPRGTHFLQIMKA